MEKRNCLDIITKAMDNKLKAENDKFNKGKLDATLGEIANITSDGTLIPSYKSLKAARVKDLLKEVETLKKYTRNLDLETQKKVFDEFYTDYRTNAMNDVANRISIANIKDRVLSRLNFKEFDGDAIKVTRDYIAQTERLIRVYDSTNKSMLLTGMDEVGATESLKDPKFLKDVVNELSNSGAAGKKGLTENPLALEASEVIKKVMDHLHAEGRRLGLDWKYIDNYMPHIWDSAKFGLVDEVEFLNDFYKGLNLDAYPGRTKEDLKGMLEEFYKDISMQDYDSILELPDSSYVKRRKDSAAKTLLRRRAIHLIPEAQYELWGKYGSADFMGNLQKYNRTLAKKFALIENFGATPSTGFDMLTNELGSRSSNPKQFAEQLKNLKNEFEQITDPMKHGKGDSFIENVGIKVRGIVAATTLSVRSTITAISADPAMFAGWGLSRMNAPIYEGVSTYFSAMSNILSVEDRKAYGKILGVVFRRELEINWEKLGMDKGLPNDKTAKAIDYAMKFTGLPVHQALSQESGLLAGAMMLSRHTDKSWSDLDVVLKTSLHREGLDEVSWDIVRKNTMEYAGETIVSPEAIRANTALGDSRRDVAHSLKKFLYRIESGVVVPGAREKNFSNAFSATTVSGQVWRSMVMFKTYPITAFNRMAEIRGYNPANPGKGNYGAVAQTIAGLMVLTHMKNAMVAWGNGQEAPDVFHPTTGLNLETLTNDIMDSGAGGLYADVLLTDYDKYAGISLAAKVGGPVFGKAGDMYEVVQGLLSTDTTVQKKSQDLFKQLGKNIPINNVPIIKPMLDYMILNTIRDMVDPNWESKRKKALNVKDVFGNESETGYKFPIVNDKLLDNL